PFHRRTAGAARPDRREYRVRDDRTAGPEAAAAYAVADRLRAIEPRSRSSETRRADRRRSASRATFFRAIGQHSVRRTGRDRANHLELRVAPRLSSALGGSGAHGLRAPDGGD